MRGRVAGQVLVALYLCILLMGVGALAESHEQIASKIGLDPDLFVTLTTKVNGTELALFVVFINERIFNSKISVDLRQNLLPYVGKNAVYVNPTVEQVVDHFSFFPGQFTVEQEGRSPFIPADADWLEITEGFLSGRFHVNPGGASYGSGSEGILVMGNHIDPSQPFWVTYQGQRARFDIVEPTTVIPPTTFPAPTGSPPRETIEVAGIETVTELGDRLTHGDFSSETVAALLDLDPTLVGTIVFTRRDEELRLLLINLEERVRESELGAELLSNIDPLIDTGAVMVWALSPTGSDFSPWHFYIQQAGTNYVFFSPSSFVELTVDFLRVDHVGSEEVAAGVILLPGGVDPHVPFTVYYGSTGRTLGESPQP